MDFQITVRYGQRYQRYHTYQVSAANAPEALEAAARAMPPDVAAEADLVEVRVAVDPDDRKFMGG
jgi:hypothetical protein